MLLLHLGSFKIDLDSKKNTWWNSLTPRTRLLGILLSVFAIALTPNGKWLTLGFYSLGAIILVIIAHASFINLFRRIAVEFAFLATAILGSLFKDGGHTIWSWGIIKITSEGLTILASVAIKTLLSLLMLNLLTLTTSIPALLNALAALGLPPILVATFASMYRYLGLLIAELKAMNQTAASRNIKQNHAWQRLIFGNMIGILFIRTYERGDKIHQAMVSRGYQGVPRIEKAVKVRKRDFLALTLITLWIVCGFILHFIPDAPQPN